MYHLDLEYADLAYTVLNSYTHFLLKEQDTYRIAN